MSFGQTDESPDTMRNGRSRLGCEEQRWVVLFRLH